MTFASPKPLLLVIALGLFGAAVTACGDGVGDAAPAIRVSVDAPAGATPEPPVTAPADATQQTIDRWTSSGPGGVTVALARAGGTVELYSSGVAATSGDAVAVDSLFRVGSVSKTFVAVMLLQLVDEGTLVLDEQVTLYAPDLTVASGVTVRQLLDHSSGIPDVAEDLLPLLLADPDRTWTPDEVLAHSASGTHDFAPGTDHSYSNTNYIIAGLLLEEVTGQSVADNLQTRVLRPLGLRDTFFAPQPGREPVTGFSFFLPGGDTTAAPYTAIETAAGAAGALVSTAPDLATFITALAAGQLLSPDMLDAMTADVADGNFGLGIEPFDTPAGVAFTHGGFIPGFMTRVGVLAETGDVFIVLGNDDTRNFDDLVTQIVASWS